MAGSSTTTLPSRHGAARPAPVGRAAGTPAAHRAPRNPGRPSTSATPSASARCAARCSAGSMVVCSRYPPSRTGIPARSACTRTTSATHGATPSGLSAVRSGSCCAASACAAVRYPCSRISASTVFRRATFRSAWRTGSYCTGLLGIAASDAASATVSSAAPFPKYCRAASSMP